MSLPGVQSLWTGAPPAAIHPPSWSAAGLSARCFQGGGNAALILGRPLGSLAQTSRNAWVAQLVEQRTENPRVAGSIPAPGTRTPSRAFRYNLKIIDFQRRDVQHRPTLLVHSHGV